MISQSRRKNKQMESTSSKYADNSCLVRFMITVSHQKALKVSKQKIGRDFKHNNTCIYGIRALKIMPVEICYFKNSI